MLFLGVSQSIGKGGVNQKDDVFATKKGLTQTGDWTPLLDIYDHPTSEPEKIFSSALEVFQGRFNLKKDGLMTPGGPTETTLRAETARIALEDTEGPKLPNPLKIKQPIGLNQPNKPEDLGPVRNALQTIAHPAIGLGTLAGNPANLQTFQTKFGLKPDGVMLPGGPTEAKINQLVAPLQATTISSAPGARSALAASNQMASVTSNPPQTNPPNATSLFKPPAKPTPPHRTTEERLFGDIDVNFVYEEEGDELSMYVPKDTKGTVLGMSGATIAKGVDLGQMNDYDLDMLVRDHGLSPALANKLRPYLGRKKDDAARFVDANPLTINKTEAHEITLAKYSSINRAFQRNFDQEMKATGKSVRFEDLDAEHKTALFSVAVQLGPHFKDRAPYRALWNAATSLNVLDFAEALEALPEFKDRRRREANLARSSNYSGR